MIKPRILPECNRCKFYGRSNYIICAVHLQGVQGKSCLDFLLDSNAKNEPKRAPKGFSVYGNDLIPNIPSRLTQGDRLHLLQTHPLFTGKCPACGYQFTDSPEGHWDCPTCFWKDDSV